ncbi:uncharacterized protein Xbp1 [Drosophila tropicalis]|uniref:uncharacterized protein Xbp1 n=1 Tax=Drosophila tropicalis TaxID=46794 RepID=UPI0035ABB3D0
MAPPVTTANSVFVTLPKLRPGPAPAPAVAALLKGGVPSPTHSSSGYASSSSVMDEDQMEVVQVQAPKAKKRRLDHLTWEEKVQRKKLKNRVAAQTSRDRKKARMEEMDYEIKELTDKTEILQNKCESLQAINEALLSKNQKLDAEMEQMRQELAEMKKQQQAKVNANSNNISSPVSLGAEGCASTNLGSAASNTTGGLTVVSAFADRGAETGAETHTNYGLSVEDCGSLPTLQDMLLVDDEEFDARRLEELAETLLAEVLETDSRACDEIAPQDAGNQERLPRSMVGTTAKCLEPSGHRIDGLESKEVKAISTQSMTNMQVLNINGNLEHPATIKAEIASCPSTSTTPTPPDTVYGTYDAKTNSITIVMDGDAVPVNEAVEEIYCEGITAVEDDMDDEDTVMIMKCAPPAASPSQVYLNVMNATPDTDDDDSDIENTFDSIPDFLSPSRTIKAISPLSRSPAMSLISHSAISDHGYESIMGSPTSHTADLTLPTADEDFPWQSGFDELFPSLI